MLLCLLFSHSICAITISPLSVQELTDRAQLIVHGIVLTKSCQRDPQGRIYTQVQVQVKDVWKGTQAGDPLLIVHGGGVLGEERVEVPGQVEYKVGEEIVAFLVLNQRNEGVTIGLAQGKFHVSKDAATGELLVRSPFHGSAAAAPGPNPSFRSDGIKPLTLSTLKARVIGIEK